MLAMVPEFEPVTGRVQHDVYHVYTVDVHSVAAVDRLRAIKRGDLATELPLASRLAAELPRPVPLFLGLFLHDIGKAHGKDHSREGRADGAARSQSGSGCAPVDVGARGVARRGAPEPLPLGHAPRHERPGGGAPRSRGRSARSTGCGTSTC